MLCQYVNQAIPRGRKKFLTGFNIDSKEEDSWYHWF